MSKSSKSWLKAHVNDTYVKKAQIDGYVSRAAYKLLEIHKKEPIFKQGMRVIDLGAAPGGWTQVAKELIGDKGQVIALDRLPMEVPPNVVFIQGDFTTDAVLDELTSALNARPVDVVMSDMAPNLSGQRSVDQPASMCLVELAWDCAKQFLKPDGVFIAKMFQGEGVDEFIKMMRKQAKTVRIRKPLASRVKSREFYLLARGILGYTTDQP